MDQILDMPTCNRAADCSRPAAGQRPKSKAAKAQDTVARSSSMAWPHGPARHLGPQQQASSIGGYSYVTDVLFIYFLNQCFFFDNVE